ncbi:hypothetical protein SALBM311S_11364 [Streptomyces alboniger]
MRKRIDAFNKTHDSVQVDFQQIPSGTQGGYAKLSNAARAGNAPDVATIEYPQIPGFAIDGVARDITDLVSQPRRKHPLWSSALSPWPCCWTPVWYGCAPGRSWGCSCRTRCPGSSRP